jgi:hypothetical protein
MTSDFLQMNDRAGGDKIDEEIFKEAAVTSFAGIHLSPISNMK